jgi:hypothetical protein
MRNRRTKRYNNRSLQLIFWLPKSVKNGFEHRHRGKPLLTDLCNQNWFWPTTSFDCKIYTLHVYSPRTLYPRKGSRYFSETPTFCQNYLAMRNTADVTGDNSIAIWAQSISDVSAINPFIAFYDERQNKRDAILLHQSRLKKWKINKYSRHSPIYIRPE